MYGCICRCLISATTVGVKRDCCLAMFVLATCGSVPARTAASTTVGLTVAESSLMLSLLGFTLLLAAKIYLHSRIFFVICARCMHSCLKLPAACAGGAFENEARIQVTLKLTQSLHPTARGRSATPRRQIV